MGAFGYGPFHNDTALDFMGGIADTIARKTLRAKRPEELIAGVYALSILGSGGVIDLNSVKKMDKRLAALLKDRSFLDRWIDRGRGMKQTIRDLRKELKTMGY